MSKQDGPNLLQVLCAYHETGHAVVGHEIGRCIERVALTDARQGYAGYCRFSAFAEDANGHSEWLNESARSDLITIYYAGMLATAFYCASYEGEDDYPEGSERDDLERINAILSRPDIDAQQREAIEQASWLQAQEILNDYWPAVRALVRKLLQRGALSGRAAHRLIWQTVGYPEDDWRFLALDIKQGS